MALMRSRIWPSSLSHSARSSGVRQHRRDGLAAVVGGLE